MKANIIYNSLLIFSLMVKLNIYGQIGKYEVKPKDFKNPKKSKLTTCYNLGIHNNFKDIVQWLEKNETDGNNQYSYLVEITIVKQGRKVPWKDEPNDFFTSWGRASFNLIHDKCVITTGDIAFFSSKENQFKSQPVKGKYDFDIVRNGYTKYSQFLNAFPPKYNLIRNKNMIYKIDSSGDMTIFNFFPFKGVRIQ